MEPKSTTTIARNSQSTHPISPIHHSTARHIKAAKREQKEKSHISHTLPLPLPAQSTTQREKTDTAKEKCLPLQLNYKIK